MLAQKLSLSAAKVSDGEARQCFATAGTQAELTCMGPKSTVSFVFWLTWPRDPPFLSKAQGRNPVR